jgi:hypothetical protein
LTLPENVITFSLTVEHFIIDHACRSPALIAEEAAVRAEPLRGNYLFVDESKAEYKGHSPQRMNDPPDVRPSRSRP